MASLLSWPPSRATYNIVVVSGAFLLLFSAYNALQNVATSLFPAGLGNASLGILYIAAALGVFLAPAAVDELGTRVTMLVGAACYVAYLACLVRIVPGVVLGMSVVIGLGAAVLWVALGEFVKENSDVRSYGRNNGLFWSIFQLNNIVGNLGTYFVFPLLSNSELFAGFAVVGAVGTALLALLRKPALDDAATSLGGAIGGGDDGGSDDVAALGGVMLRVNGEGAAAARIARCARGRRACVSMAATARLLFTLDSALLLPMYAFSGFELAFWTGEFTQLLTPAVIGLVLAFSGVGEVAGGLAFGRLSDSLGRSASIGLGALLYAGGLGLTAWIRASGGGLPGGGAGVSAAGAPLAAYAAALLFGLGDSAFNTNLYAIISQVYGRQVAAAVATAGVDADADGGAVGVAFAPLSDGDDEDGGMDVTPSKAEDRPPSVLAFSCFQLAQNAGSAACYYLALQLPLHGASGTYALLYLQAAFLALSMATCVAVDCRHAPRHA